MSFIVKAVKSVVKAVVKVASSVVKAVVNVVSSVINFVMQPFMGLLGGLGGMPDAASEVARQQGVLVQTEGSNINVPVIYGYRKVGGTVVFAETGSTNNKYLYVAYVFTEGPIEGLREVFIDDWQLPVDQTGSLNGGSVITVNADRYKDRVQLQWFHGKYFDNIASSSVGNTVKTGIFSGAPSFKSNMNFNGLAVLFARYEWREIKTQADADSNPFSGNIPNLQVSLLGRRVASLLVNAEDYSYASAPERYSTNPAEILLDYLRNPRYGKGLFNDDIHWDSWKKVARKCNQTVTYVTSGITGPILTCNHVLDTSQTIFSNIKTLLMGFRSYMPYVQGKYKLKIEDAGNDNDILSGVATIVGIFNKDNIIGNVTYTGIDKSSKYNVVNISYVDPDQKFSVQQVIFPETEEERQVYIDKDGGRENKLDATFPSITNYAIAKDMAKLLFFKSRRQETCSLTVSSQGIELEPGDNIQIQSNILNFNSDPWRVISVKINDNMTVDLGCVRNPDDIYPHARFNEEDIILPTYVPKGSIIYYPSSENRIPLGLVPPLNAVYPPVYTPTVTNPGSTNLDAPGGGGVGGGSPPGGAGPTTPVAPIVPVSPINTPPVAPPPTPPFSAVLTLKSTSISDQANGTAIFHLIFTQPSDGLYDHSTFWWRLNRYSPWVEIAITTKPGSGGDIPITVGPLAVGGVNQYDYFVRSFATDGRASNFVVTGNFLTRYSTTVVDQLIGVGSAGAIQITDAWDLPLSDIPAAPVYNDSIESFAITPKLVLGAPSDPRRLTVTMQQLVNTLAAPFNSLIDGVKIYYRFKGDTYWSYEDYKFSSQGAYYGQSISFDLTGDFGAAVYPGDALFTGNALQQYEFLVRLTYADGHLAEKQMGPAIGPVEQNATGLRNHIIVGTSPYASARVSSVTIPVAFNSTFLTVDQNPNQTFAVGSDITPVLFEVVSDPSISKLTFYFTPPTNSKFRGYLIRYREIVPTQLTAFTTLTISGTPNIAGTCIGVVTGGTYSHSKKYEWVITAQYSLNGVTTDCNTSIYAKVMVPFGNYYNQAAQFNSLPQMSTSLALGKLLSIFPALGTVNPKSWIKKQVLPYSSATYCQFFGTEISYTNGTYNLNTYYQFKFQPTPAATDIVVYRRVYDTVGITKTTIKATTSGAKYYGLGAWDKFTVSLSSPSITTDAEGWRTISVRGPIDPIVFDGQYQVTAGRTLYDEAYGPAPSNYPYKGAKPYITDVYPYYGAGNTQINNANTKWVEFIFVMSDSGIEDINGLRLRDFATTGQVTQFSTIFTPAIDGFTTGNVLKDDVVSLATFNTLTPGYNRNLNEAITNIPLAGLSDGSRFIGNYGVPNGPTTYTTYNKFLNNPTNGDIVY